MRCHEKMPFNAYTYIFMITWPPIWYSDEHVWLPSKSSRVRFPAILWNFSGSVGSGTGSTQPREDNWVATWMGSSEILLRKLKWRLRDKLVANHKAPCTAVWQHPLQSVLALWGCSVTDLIQFNFILFYNMNLILYILYCALAPSGA